MQCTFPRVAGGVEWRPQGVKQELKTSEVGVTPGKVEDISRSCREADQGPHQVGRPEEADRDKEILGEWHMFPHNFHEDRATSALLALDPQRQH